MRSTLKWAAPNPRALDYAAAAILLVLSCPWATAGEMATRHLLADGLESPTNLAHLDDGRIFVLEPYEGRIRVIDDDHLLDEPFLSVRDRIDEQPHVEGGLLGVAFPPDFTASRAFYVVYTDKDNQWVLSRFTATPDGRHALADSQQILLSIPRSSGRRRWHNCGHIEFSSDGQLYLCVGDMDSLPNPTGSAQNLHRLQGKILRLDPTASRIDPKIVAYGLKNPWRFTIMPSGRLIVPDVGWSTWEELNLLRLDAPRPLNLGWNLAEGNDCRRGSCDGDLVWPLYVYPHEDVNCAIVGGALYQGTVQPAWRGVYVFGDYCSGELWAIRNIETAPEITKIAAEFSQISAVGTDADGEIIVSDFGADSVYRLELPAYDAAGWESTAMLVQRQSVETRRAGFHSTKAELEALYSSRRWAVITRVYELYDRIVAWIRF